MSILWPMIGALLHAEVAPLSASMSQLDVAALTKRIEVLDRELDKQVTAAPPQVMMRQPASDERALGLINQQLSGNKVGASFEPYLCIDQSRSMQFPPPKHCQFR